MSGIDKVGASGVQSAFGPDDAPDAGAAAAAQSGAEAAQAVLDPATTQAAWDAHAADVGSAALRAALHEASGEVDVQYDPDFQTLEEFYAEMPGEVREMDQGIDTAGGVFRGMSAEEAAAAKAAKELIAQGGREMELAKAMVALASALKETPPDIAKVTRLADEADARVLDFASKGDPQKRAVMARHYGRSVEGGGAFGNDIAVALRRGAAAQAAQGAGQSAGGAFAGAAQAIQQAAPGIGQAASQGGAFAGAAQAIQHAAPGIGQAAQQQASSQAAQQAPVQQGAPAEGPGKPGAAGGKAPAGYDSLDAARSGDYVRKGSSGPQVEALQKALNAAGIQPPLEVNGTCGPEMEAAIRKFQAEHGCAVDGLVGPETMGALDAALGLPPKSGKGWSGVGGGGGAQGPGQFPGGADVPGIPPPSGPTSGGESRLAALRSARSQIGIREASGNNDGVPASRFSNGRNVPWCANFVSWNFRQAGNPLPGNQVAIGSCDTMANELKRAGMWIGKQTPQPGDVIFFGTPGDYTHVGIVDRVEGGRVYTVEGNSGNRVAERSYSLSDGRIQGYGRPT
jgi:peptidoglycan hydrolase-like protein with peptidoglycan-binding domain